MTLLVKVEGIYQSDAGEKAKQNIPFEFDLTLCGTHTKCLASHLVCRHVPMRIREEKEKPYFTRMKHFKVVSHEVIDNECSINGKDIFKMNEYELQELARYFNLLEVPLPGSTLLSVMRENAALAYLKNVLKVPMETEAEKEKLDFYVKQPDGSFKFVFAPDAKLFVEVSENFEKEHQKVETKLSLADVQKSTTSETESITSDFFVKQNELTGDSDGQKNTGFMGLLKGFDPFANPNSEVQTPQNPLTNQQDA